MLGEKIGEMSGKLIRNACCRSKVEFQKWKRRSCRMDPCSAQVRRRRAPYCTVSRPDGTLYGEGQGVTTAKDGKIATWTGHGVGTVKKNGAATYRGALYYQTMPSRRSRLNKIAVVFEYVVDAEGNTRSEYWEWK